MWVSWQWCKVAYGWRERVRCEYDVGVLKVWEILKIDMPWLKKRIALILFVRDTEIRRYEPGVRESRVYVDSQSDTDPWRLSLEWRRHGIVHGDSLVRQHLQLHNTHSLQYTYNTELRRLTTSPNLIITPSRRRRPGSVMFGRRSQARSSSPARRDDWPLGRRTYVTERRNKAAPRRPRDF